MPKRRLLVLALAGIVLVLVPTGCEFPGPAVTVTFTSPSNNQRIIGSRTLPVTGLISGTDPSAFSLTLNGSAVNLALPTAGTFSTSVTLKDGANTLVATATASGETSSATLDLYYPYLALGNGQDASTVVGQANFGTANAGTTISTLSSPVGAPALVGGNLYIPDTANNRVVGMAGVPSFNGASFSILLGQTSWTTSDPGTLLDRSFSTPSSVTGTADQLIIADPGHNRVLIYGGVPTVLNTPARSAVGQSSLTATRNTSCDAVHLADPQAAFVTPTGRLVVADTGHHRVLIWNSIPEVSGTPADGVLGQTDLTSCLPNRGGSASKSTLSGPRDVWSDGTRLAVADTGNNRVLIWTSFPTAKGAPADVLIDQGTIVPGPGQPAVIGLSAPRGVGSNGNQLFLSDTGHHRILGFDLEPSINLTPTIVLGQADFSGTAANRSGSTAANTLSGPQGVRVFDGMLMVADTGNTRELIYRP
ncbi:MAG: hypothetical protein P8Y02_01680 [Deinococcales bacterium]